MGSTPTLSAKPSLLVPAAFLRFIVTSRPDKTLQCLSSRERDFAVFKKSPQVADPFTFKAFRSSTIASVSRSQYLSRASRSLAFSTQSVSSKTIR